MTKQISYAARALAVGLVAALVLAGTAMGTVQLSNSGGGSWQYYKEITISNSGGALSDYQVLVQLSSSNFPTNARSDGADIRFTDANGNELSYWIESWDYAGRSAKIWVKVPSIPAGEITTIHMYNGNPSAGSASSGDATFEFFDDFDDNSRNGWNAIFDSDVFTEQTQRMEYSVGWNGMTQRNHILVANKVFSNFNFIIDFYSQTLGSGNYRSNGWAIYNSPSSFGAYVNYGDSGGGSFCGNDGCSISPPFGMTSQQTIGNCGNSNKHSISVRYNGSYLSVLCGNGAIPNVQIASFKGTLPSSYQFGLNGDEGGGGTTENHAYWDNFRVRKYASSEPTVSFSAEQPILKEPSTIATAAPTVSRTGLVAEYHFDGDAKDSSGNGNDGTIYGATFVDGISGKALSFNGVDNYVSTSLTLNKVPKTYESWINLKGNSKKIQWIVGADNAHYNGHLIWLNDLNKLEFLYCHSEMCDRYASDSSVSEGKWYQFVVVVDSTYSKIYINGNLDKEYSGLSIGTVSAPAHTIGKHSGSNDYYFKGAIDEVRIYNRALSAEEIKANYDSTLGKSPATTAIKSTSAPTSSPATPAPTIAQTTIPTPAPTAAPEPLNSYVYAGIGGLVLILVAIVALKRRSSSKVEEPLKREPSVKPEPQKPTPLAEPPKIKPAPTTAPEAPGVYVKTAFGYKGAAIIYKLKIENNTSDPISDIKVYPYVPDVFLLREKEKSIALIEPRASQTVTFEIRPTGECGDCNVSGRVNYYDMESRKRQDIELEPKSLSIVCPMLHGKEINEAEWHDTVSNLVKTEESTREIEMPAESLFTMVSRIIKDMHMYMQKPEVTQNHKLFNGVARFYGEGVKGLKYAAQVEVVGGAKKSKLILKVWAEKEDALTGFYHGMLDEIEKRVNVKEYIDDSIVQYNVHIGDKIGTLVKDSVVQRSTIGASSRKCPDCGREVEANEKFCLECGAKL